MPRTYSVILSEAKDLGIAGEVSLACGTDFPFLARMLHFVQHDRF